MTSDDEKDFDFGDETDPDTNLILDYLSNKLDPEDAERLEARAKQDKDFRYKLADIVLLKGLVTLALEKNPSPTARSCRRTQRLFLDYLKGRTSVEKTGELSRHLDECFECELAFERFQEHGIKQEERGGWGGSWRKSLTSGRHLVIAGLVVAALAAGAFGIVGFLSAASSGGPRVEAPAGWERDDGTLLRPDQVRRALGDVLAAGPSLDATRLSAAVDQIIDETTTPDERADLYAQLGKDFGSGVEALLWVLAQNEPIELPRRSAYQAIDLQRATDRAALLAAARREADRQSRLTHLFVPVLAKRVDDQVREFLRALVAGVEAREDDWSLQHLRAIYAPLRGDPVIESHVTACLSHKNDRVRSVAALTAADAGRPEVVNAALDLLRSPDAAARFNALLMMRRHGTEEQFLRALSPDSPLDVDTKTQLRNAMSSRGFSPPQHP